MRARNLSVMVGVAVIIAGCSTGKRSRGAQLVKAVTAAELQPALSPEFRQVLDASLEARAALSCALAQTLGGRHLRVRYFYRGNPKEAWSEFFDYGPNMLYVDLAMGQTGWDEYVTFMFELENSLNSGRSQELWSSALRGKLSPLDYASALLKLEYAALCRTKARIASVSAAEPHLVDSKRYQEMIEGTRSFDGYVREAGMARDKYADRVREARGDNWRTGPWNQ